LERVGRFGLGLAMAAALLILSGFAPALADSGEPGMAGSASTEAVATPADPHVEKIKAVEQLAPRDPTRGGVSPDANAADWAAPNPTRYPQMDVPTKPWAYDTSYFFGLTRGLDDEPLSTWCRRASMVGTVPVDVVGLPTAALAGLFGS
jgi:hypothetical protein